MQNLGFFFPHSKHMLIAQTHRSILKSLNILKRLKSHKRECLADVIPRFKIEGSKRQDAVSLHYIYIKVLLV